MKQGRRCRRPEMLSSLFVFSSCVAAAALTATRLTTTRLTGLTTALLTGRFRLVLVLPLTQRRFLVLDLRILRASGSAGVDDADLVKPTRLALRVENGAYQIAAIRRRVPPWIRRPFPGECVARKCSVRGHPGDLSFQPIAPRQAGADRFRIDQHLSRTLAPYDVYRELHRWHPFSSFVSAGVRPANNPCRHRAFRAPSSSIPSA